MNFLLYFTGCLVSIFGGYYAGDSIIHSNGLQLAFSLTVIGIGVFMCHKAFD